MHGSGRSQGWLVHLIAGAALGAVVVLVLWILSGGRPFGEIVGTGDVSRATPPAAQRTAADPRAQTSAERVSRLASEPPEMKRRSSEPKAERPAMARRAPKAKTPRRSPARRRPAVPVVAPPARPVEDPEQPVAAVPAPTATAAPAPPPPAPRGGADKPAKRRAPAYVIGAGEG